MESQSNFWRYRVALHWLGRRLLSFQFEKRVMFDADGTDWDSQSIPFSGITTTLSVIEYAPWELAHIGVLFFLQFDGLLRSHSRQLIVYFALAFFGN